MVIFEAELMFSKNAVKMLQGLKNSVSLSIIMTVLFKWHKEHPSCNDVKKFKKSKVPSLWNQLEDWG